MAIYQVGAVASARQSCISGLVGLTYRFISVINLCYPHVVATPVANSIGEYLSCYTTMFLSLTCWGLGHPLQLF